MRQVSTRGGGSGAGGQGTYKLQPQQYGFKGRALGCSVVLSTHSRKRISENLPMNLTTSIPNSNIVIHFPQGPLNVSTIGLRFEFEIEVVSVSKKL